MDAMYVPPHSLQLLMFSWKHMPPLRLRPMRRRCSDAGGAAAGTREGRSGRAGPHGALLQHRRQGSDQCLAQEAAGLGVFCAQVGALESARRQCILYTAVCVSVRHMCASRLQDCASSLMSVHLAKQWVCFVSFPFISFHFISFHFISFQLA